MFWRVELDKEGSILSCDLAEGKGRNGGRVIYVEAETKTEACTNAKHWHEHKKNYMRTFSRELRERRIRDGMCTGCGKKRAREGRRTCTACANNQSARDKAGAAGRELLSPEEARRRQQEQSQSWHKRRGGTKGIVLRAALHKLDELGPDAYRRWLVAEIVRIDSEFHDPLQVFSLVVNDAE